MHKEVSSDPILQRFVFSFVVDARNYCIYVFFPGSHELILYSGVLPSDITLNEGQAKILHQQFTKNGVLYRISGVLTQPSDLADNTVMDVAQDLGCDIFLDYMFRGNMYDRLRENSEPSLNRFITKNRNFSFLCSAKTHLPSFVQLQMASQCSSWRILDSRLQYGCDWTFCCPHCWDNTCATMCKPDR